MEESEKEERLVKAEDIAEIEAQRDREENERDRRDAEFRAVMFPKARAQTFETLPAFIEEVRAFKCGYSGAAYKTAAVALAAAWAMSREEGITGFQAGGALWEFIGAWQMWDDGRPARLLDFEQFLYPQYEHDFNPPTMRQDTFAWLQKRSAELLAEGRGVPEVRAHWQSIVDGKVPFGWRIEAPRENGGS